jgi:hypothetical protein
MNKNKLIFWIIWASIILWIILLIFQLKSNWYLWTISQARGVLKIWVIWENVDWFSEVADDFKSDTLWYSKQNILIENFSNYADYSIALTSAIIWDQAPDIFVLNNNEKNSIFSNQVGWISSSFINPSDFRKNYIGIFSDDLILSVWEWESREEFLSWLPVWYETLGIFYNRRYVKNSDLTSISTMNNFIADVKEKRSNIIPIWIWNWSYVYDAADIITQFFLYEWNIFSLYDLIWKEVKKALISYILYWTNDWYNWLNIKSTDLEQSWWNSIDLFAKWETYMVMWYPSMINEIKERWFSKNFLMAAPFPKNNSWVDNILVNYNYFVINKRSNHIKLANMFLAYLSREKASSKYLDSIPYSFPALISLEKEKLEKYIDEDYNIILNDFLNIDAELYSFDKWIKNLYDSNIISILDNELTYSLAFEKFRKLILCKAKKISSLTDFTSTCE